MKNKFITSTNYQYGFSDQDTNLFSLKKGLSVDIIKKISQIKQEPK
jgi:hypothetical protein